MDVVYFPSAFLHAITQVEVLAVHEKLLIKSSGTFEYVAPHKQERPADRVDFIRFIRIKIGKVVPGKHRGMGKKRSEADHLRQRHPRRGITPATGKLQRTIRIEDFTSAQSNVAMLVEEAHHHGNCVFLYDRIGIEEQQILSRGLPHGTIIGSAK